MKIRLARDIQTDSIVDGEGLRTVIWTQGCIHNCPGCHNPETHSFTEGYTIDVEELNNKLVNLKDQDGITLSGGDPMCQIDAILEVCKSAKKNGLNIWCYTGFLFDDLYNRSLKEMKLKELLKYIDVIIDGKFILEKKSFDVIFRGSTNQRIIDVSKSLKEGKTIEAEKYKSSKDNKFKKRIYI